MHSDDVFFCPRCGDWARPGCEDCHGAGRPARANSNTAATVLILIVPVALCAVIWWFA